MPMPARRLAPSDQPAPTLWSADDDTLQPVAPNPAEAAEHSEVIPQPATASAATATEPAPAAASSTPAPVAAPDTPTVITAPAVDGQAGVVSAPRRPPALPRPGRSGLRLATGARPATSAREVNGDDAGPRGPMGLARANLRALEILARLDGDWPPGVGDRAALVQWAGWGPMAKAFDPYERSAGWRQLGERLRQLLLAEDGAAAQQATATSFYTSPTVTGAIWRILQGLGFDGGQVLEPGCGSGLFITAAPAGLPIAWTGVERDPVSARIAALLHPAARIITAPLERVSLPPCGLDAAVGNVPFADVTPYDPCAPKLSLHNYFIWRAVQAVHPGGLVAMVTSRYTLDAEDPQARALLATDADLVGAIRLPTGAFHQQGTEVVTDILVLRRRAAPRDQDEPAPLWLAAERRPQLRTAVNRYYLAHPEQVLGRLEPSGGAYHGHTLQVAFDGDPAVLQAALIHAAERVIATAVAQRLTYSPRPDPAAIPADVVLVDRAGRKDGSFHLVNGTVHQVVGGRGRAVPRAGAELTALIGLRDATLALLDAETDPETPTRGWRRCGPRSTAATTATWPPTGR